MRTECCSMVFAENAYRYASCFTTAFGKSVGRKPRHTFSIFESAGKEGFFVYHPARPYICPSQTNLMFKYTRHSLKKLETLLEELDYTVRYEKGNFNSGYCIVENRKVAVINKFFDTEGRINCLVDILGKMDVQAGQLSEPSAKFFKKINDLTASEEEEEE